MYNQLFDNYLKENNIDNYDNIIEKLNSSIKTFDFDTVEKNLEQTIINDNDQTAEEELETISPLLGQLKNKPTYTIPEGYFENLQTAIAKENLAPEVKVISISSRKWFRYAAAALVVGFVGSAQTV